MKTHYELLGVEPSADAEAIKKAFRHEISRYHPDKVSHLGAEFQEIASTRAAELTAAYKILSDPQTRARYDAELTDLGKAGGVVTPPTQPSDPVVPQPESLHPTAEPAPERPPQPGRGFEADRADKDEIVRRATVERVRQSLPHLLGDCDQRMVPGFDLAFVPRSKPVASRAIAQLFEKPATPSVLVRIVPLVSAAVALDAFREAMRSRLGTKEQPVALLLIGNQLAPARELAQAIEDARRRAPDHLEKIFPVPIDGRDWSAKVPLNTPPAIKALINRLKSSV